MSRKCKSAGKIDSCLQCFLIVNNLSRSRTSTHPLSIPVNSCAGSQGSQFSLGKRLLHPGQVARPSQAVEH